MQGPLKGTRVVEIAAIGPAPFCAMLLADMGADVIRVERKGERPRAGSGAADVLQRGRRSIALDLKRPGAASVVLKLVEQSHMLVEGFRPGVMERIGLGPDTCMARNPALVYGRVTGWGQQGPLAHRAGHDIDFMAISGALYGMGDPDRPPMPPLNLVGDFGGGGMLLAFGMACALIEAQRSGRGQVVDAAMSDGSALLMSMLYGYLAMGRWKAERGANFLDGSSPFYRCYRCADGKWLAVGAVEGNFYRELLRRCGLPEALVESQWDEQRWPETRRVFEETFLTRTRDEWCELLGCADTCIAPVLDMREAPAFPHNVARGAFLEIDGITQPAPAPRMSGTPGYAGRIAAPGEHTMSILADLGFSGEEIDEFRVNGVC
ncbi:alpha-methylacyl-CoA racemase [Variovorax sp. HW608]|uniref:CaiB/BaiF CoA transferase family protein n=1 Tax=Variovorax sp. HW608 TaxID=1034889 RepID=UPI00081FED1F|nr:CaiB/BaiF CoA-transferase family protein [Variovorax sp. HW608]SCK42953.1 alpha-methylacyl-CoA racemase [Variovorax sp. HW608]